MGPKTLELINQLDSLYNLLIQVEEKHWSQFILTCKKEIESGDFQGITRFCSSNGGMASLNDLVIHPMNNHKINLNNVNSMNDLFFEKRTKAFTIANQIKHEFNQKI